MTTVQINDKTPITKVKIKFIVAGELFRFDNKIYLMTDEADCNGDELALLITDDDSTFGTLISFEETDEVVRLNGTITVKIN